MEIFFTKHRESTVQILFVTTLILLISCANSRKSAQKITDAEIRMQQIEQVEAMDYASAAFQEAQSRLEEARQLVERGKHKKAMLKADEAIVSAELAEVKTLARKADDSLRELKASIASLKEQLNQYRQDQ